MSEFPPAVNGMEQRLDVLIAEIRRLNELLSGPQLNFNDDIETPEEIRLREPVTPKSYMPTPSGHSSPAPVTGKKK